MCSFNFILRFLNKWVNLFIVEPLCLIIKCKNTICLFLQVRCFTILNNDSVLKFIFNKELAIEKPVPRMFTI